MLKVGVALALVAIALSGSSLSGTQSIGGYAYDSSWSDMSTVVLSPSETDLKTYYSVRLSGSSMGGALTCKAASQTSSSSPFAAASDCSSAFSSSSTSTFSGSGAWLTKMLDSACLMTTSNKNGKTCSALSGLAGVGIFVYVLISCALACLTIAFAGMVEAHIVARQLADKKEGGDGGAAILTAATRPARYTWALLFVALLLISFAVISWAIVVTAALGSIKDAILAGDYTSGTKLENYTSYILFRPGSSWYILIVAIAVLTTALRQVTIHKGATFRTAE